MDGWHAGRLADRHATQPALKERVDISRTGYHPLDGFGNDGNHMSLGDEAIRPVLESRPGYVGAFVNRD